MSTKTMSTSRFSRCATASKIRPAISGSASSKKSIARYAASSENPPQPAIATRSATHRVAASLLPGSSARCATSANSARSAAAASRRRSAATRCSAAPTPSRSQSRSSSHAPPKRRESRMSISLVCAAAIACSGSRNREIEATSRASASRSTVSARPKLWITFAEGTPVTGWRSLRANCRYDTVDPSRFRRFVSRRYTPTPLAHIRWSSPSNTPEFVCLHKSAIWATLQACYQRNRSALPRMVPTNCGSRGRDGVRNYQIQGISPVGLVLLWRW